LARGRQSHSLYSNAWSLFYSIQAVFTELIIALTIPKRDGHHLSTHNLPLAMTVNILLNPRVSFRLFGGLKSPARLRRLDLAGL
ncbi:MAG: hypothetical protein VXA34_11875, partial [Gammaproteobacteria bacterium]